MLLESSVTLTISPAARFAVRALHRARRSLNAFQFDLAREALLDLGVDPTRVRS